ncbi:MAG: OB-fold domain-containing protein [Microbacterium sp.]
MPASWTTPYAVGAVLLDDGPRLVARVDAPFEEIRVGARVHAVYNAVTPAVTLLRWAPD